MSFIYVIAARPEGPCKIGLSADPERRLRQLQTGASAPLAVHHAEPFDSRDRTQLIERIIHKDLKFHRLTGEWFALSVKDAVAEVQHAAIRYSDERNLRNFLGSR